MFKSICKSCKAEPGATKIDVCHDCAEGIAWASGRVTKDDEAALIIESVRHYLQHLEDDNFKKMQTDVAKKYFKKYLGLNLSDDGKSIKPC